MNIGEQVVIKNCLEAKIHGDMHFTVASKPRDLCGSTVVEIICNSNPLTRYVAFDVDNLEKLEGDL